MPSFTHPLRAPRAALLAALLAALVAACSSGMPPDDGGVRGALGSSCNNDFDCRSGLVCAAATHTCSSPGNVPLDGQCILTLDCQAGLYCSNRNTCRPSGFAGPGELCTDTSTCVRGAVCVRNSPGLYGLCQFPNGATPVMPDGTPYADAGVRPGTAQDIGGMCTTVLDCLAGLQCWEQNNTCVNAATVFTSMDGGLTGPFAGVTCDDSVPDAGVPNVRAYFEVPDEAGTPRHDFFRLPFPNDIRRDATTGRINLTGFPHPGTAIIGFDIVDRYARAAERELDGFGTNQHVYFRFSGAIDYNSVNLGTNIQLIDLTTGNPTSALGFGATSARNQYLCENNLEVTTAAGVPMTPGHTYAAILSSSLRGANGMPVVADADFTAMLGANAPTDARLARAYPAYAPLRAYLTAHMIAPATVISAAVFTTQHPTNLPGALRDAVRAAPAPTASDFVVCDTGVRSPCDDGLTGAAHVRGCIGAADPAFYELQGHIDVPVFQSGTRPYSTPGEGAITVDAMGHPMIQRTERVCASITIPRGASAPTEGWPTVLYAHGTGGSFRSGVTDGLAASLANVDTGDGMTSHIALVTYEGVMHGERRGAGVTDSPDVLFFNFANPEAARDNVLQGAADVFAMVRALETVTLPMLPTAGTTTAFDPRRISFLGHSQGATVGVPAVAYENDLQSVVLSGAGGDLRVSLTTKRRPVDIASLIPAALQDPDATGGHPVLNLFQSYFERADAVNYGDMLLYARPMGAAMRPLLQTYGLNDTYSTNLTMQALASSIHLPAAGTIPGGMMAWPPGNSLALPVSNNLPTAQGMTTAALIEADPMGAYDGHFVLFRDAAMRQRVLVFLATASRGMAVIR